ncbi:hypothetical protein BASA61_009003 [Batrachochytrium salamandrivorans]|nr:hypothetical protein BASA61_009003 [Batrachochytrium salamandrivorans]KAH9270815.1 hypothetical protein BASA83_006966 [Batrachochytrium salamandrivorans]
MAASVSIGMSARIVGLHARAAHRHSSLWHRPVHCLASAQAMCDISTATTINGTRGSRYSHSSRSRPSSHTAWFKGAMVATAMGTAVALGVGSSLLNTQALLGTAESSVPVTREFEVEPISGVKVPTHITIKHDGQDKDFELLGYGVRQVTLLYISVYTASIYTDQALRHHIANSARWTQEYVPSKLTKSNTESKWFIQDLVNGHKGEITLRLDPVRNTDGPHLRNGVVRFLTERQRQELQRHTITDQESAAFTLALDELRSLFPVGRIKIGQTLVFTHLRDGHLRVEFDGREMGIVRNRHIANWVVEGYLRNKPPISPGLLSTAAASIERIVR